jgi:uncharacterized protein
MTRTASPSIVFEPEGATASAADRRVTVLEWIGYAALGTMLGVLFVKSEVISWYRIQEMFRFESFHMYGVIASALVVASTSVWLIRRVAARTLTGDPIVVAPKEWTRSGARYWMGGVVFGLGWALLGTCPGPIFAFLGAGHTVYVVPLVSAMAGTFAYGVTRDRLPH